MKSNIGIIISREFYERVGKKNFILTTLLTPLFMVLLMAAPTLVLMLSSSDAKTIAVVDKSGAIYNTLAENAKGKDFITLEKSDKQLNDLTKDEKYYGVLVIGDSVITNPSDVKLYTHESSSLELEEFFNSNIASAVQDLRLKKYDIENLDKIIEEVKASTTVQTFRLSDNGEEESMSSMLSFGLGIVMSFMLYMFLLMYGQMVMTSIIEEKNNRVLELIVSSVKPSQLMLGKIIGIALVAVLQVVIWGVLMCLFSGLLLPVLMPEQLAEQVAMVNAGSFNASASTTFDPDMVQTIASFSNVGFIASLFFYLIIFLSGGFLFYASIFAAIGSAVDNVQDASQLTTFATLPIIVALIFSMTVASDPNSTLALWLSFIPFTSPMVMLSRIPFDIPAWQIWTSAVTLFLSFGVMVWIAAKIYRVGIFMYGKKPTIKDLVRWARYK